MTLPPLVFLTKDLLWSIAALQMYSYGSRLFSEWKRVNPTWIESV